SDGHGRRDTCRKLQVQSRSTLLRRWWRRRHGRHIGWSRTQRHQRRRSISVRRKWWRWARACPDQYEGRNLRVDKHQLDRRCCDEWNDRDALNDQLQPVPVATSAAVRGNSTRMLSVSWRLISPVTLMQSFMFNVGNGGTAVVLSLSKQSSSRMSL